MTKDLNSNISLVEYNSLNLPSVITFSNNMDNITNIYTSTGTKLRSISSKYAYLLEDPLVDLYAPTDNQAAEPMLSVDEHPDFVVVDNDAAVAYVQEEDNALAEAVDDSNDEAVISEEVVNAPSKCKRFWGNIGLEESKITDYCGNVIYQDGKRMLLVDEGYVTFNDNDSLSYGEGLGGACYHYYLKDHLGNVRVVFNDQDSIEQVNDYYAFGGIMATSWGGDTQRYKYNGKELETVHGLDWYDYGARWMSPVIGRFTTPDPKAWDYTDVSPYVYCMNNPIKLIDPTGMIWEDPKDAENLKSRIDNKIESINKDNTKLQAKIDKGGLSNKKLAKLRNRLAENNERINNLNQSKADIDLLGEDNNTYVFSNINGGEHHVRLGDDQKVYIETSSDALSIHEITHVRQSLVAGGLKFKNGNLLNTGTTSRGKAKMEIEAYKMQYSYDKSFPGYINSINDINIQSVGNIKKENGEFVYQEINTLYMNELEQKRNNKKLGF